MANYTSSHSGPQIDEGVRRALEFSQEDVGMKVLKSSLNAPYNLNDVIEPGFYSVEYFENAPSSVSKQRPIQMQVTVQQDDSGRDILTQTLPTAGGNAFRSSKDGGSNWDDWTVTAEPAFLETTGDLSVDGTYCEHYSVDSSAAIVANNAQFSLKIHAPCAASPTLAVNGKDNVYDIVDSKGVKLRQNDLIAGSYVMLYFGGIPWNYEHSNQDAIGKFYLIGAPVVSDNDRFQIDEYDVRLHGESDDDTIGQDSTWWRIDSEKLMSDRVLVSHDPKEDKRTPRRIVASHLSLDQANAVSDLGASSMVMTDSDGKVTTTDGLSTAVVKSIHDLRNEENVRKLVAVDASGLFYTADVTSENVAEMGHLAPNQVVVTNAEGQPSDSNVPTEKLTALGALSNSGAVVTDANGRVVSSTTTAAEIKALGDLSANGLVITDANGAVKSVASSANVAANAATILYSTAANITNPTITDFPDTFNSQDF